MLWLSGLAVRGGDYESYKEEDTQRVYLSDAGDGNGIEFDHCDGGVKGK